MKLTLNHQPLAAAVRVSPTCATYPTLKPQEGLWTRLSLELPANLRMWFCDSVIACWIELELKNLGDADCASSCSDSWGEVADMLSVLVFGYAGLVFGSDDIAAACRSDPAFRRLCHEHSPFPGELRNCRRRHRSLLERILTGVFIQAIKRKFGLSSALLPIELEEDLRQHAAERLDFARHMDTNPAGVW